MKTYTPDEMKAILADHAKWLRNDGGSRANLTDADLTDANLTDADLTRANLTDADLTRANNIPAFQICEGDLIVYKKVQGKIVTLAIAKDVKRTASIVGRKCRSESALVLEIEGHEPVTSNGCRNGIDTIYDEGKIVLPDSYDDDWRVECSHGIHWFQTRKEAEEWQS
jgi:hypothetical protein